MGALRAVLSAAVLVGTLAATSGVALAGRDWCADDPIFHLGGANFKVTARWDSGAPVSSIGYVLDVPANVSASATVPGSTRVPTNVSINRSLPAWDGQSALSVVLHVTVTADRPVPVAVEAKGHFTGVHRVEGTANQVIAIPSLTFEKYHDPEGED